ncbi:MAG: hypothetical protein A3I61_18665 [Acidobacteria bacterium RIFCSPLOWO2_02_FULL_68_18]|nr:MAG: hypothetical protein A3I61_18665 [Acidobacteria bacterium RIFCSPLOWO2_02_FULL_68_18]OFW48068.1 MAG: hypothetical protein A3G77_11280 [Acidobacteria bacterium RIFCSPLOWO2_12_FULL_68_19]
MLGFAVAPPPACRHFLDQRELMETCAMAALAIYVERLVESSPYGNANGREEVITGVPVASASRITDTGDVGEGPTDTWMR